MRIDRLGLGFVAATVLSAFPCPAQSTERASVDSGGAQGDLPSSLPSVSSDGLTVAFFSAASNLVAGDSNGVGDVFVHDRPSGLTTCVSVGPGGTQANGESGLCSISADGRYVAFESSASNLVAGDTNALLDVFVHDRQTGATARVSVSSGGTQANGSSIEPWISSDGGTVAFRSAANNLVPGDTNGVSDVFVHDLQSGATTRASLTSGGGQANSHNFDPVLSSDGRLVAFWSIASNLVPGDTNSNFDIFVHDRQTGATSRVSVSSSGAQADNGSIDPSLSSDGRFVAFLSSGSNLVPGDTNGSADIFVHDRQSGATTRVSVDSSGSQSNGESFERPSISASGRHVAFVSEATNLVAGDTNAVPDVFVHDRQTGATTRVSVDSAGTQADDWNLQPALSGDGRYAAFRSEAVNLVPGDTNAMADVFVHDRGSRASFPASCFGDGSGAPCGCANEAPPGSRGGCRNGLGLGAVLSATGSASLTSDTLQLTSTGLPAQPGLFFQGDNLIGGGSGVSFGDGIRCCGAGVVRLEIVLPAPPEPATASTAIVISQHAPPGTLHPGDTKCYQHWYRDPASSPCGSNFNLSNAVQATWSP